MEIKLRKTREREVFVMQLSGQLDLYNSTTFSSVFDKLIARKAPRILVDLDDVDYIDSSGIGCLITAFSQCKSHGIKMALCNVKGTVKRVMELTKLLGFFAIEADVKAGIEFLSGGMS